MRVVLPYWPAEDLAALVPELEQHLQRGSLTGLNIFALALIQRSGVAPHAPVDESARLFRRRLERQLDALEAVEARLTASRI